MEYIVGRPVEIFYDSSLLWPGCGSRLDSATWGCLFFRPRWSCPITSSSIHSGWSRGLSLRTWNLLSVRTTVWGHIATCSGLSDLLLDPRLFHSRFQSYSWLSWLEHHSLQQLFNDVDGLIGLFHHSLKLCLSTCHLGEVNLSVQGRLLFSGPLGRIWSLSLVLAFKGLIFGQVLGMSPPRHYC